MTKMTLKLTLEAPNGETLTFERKVEVPVGDASMAKWVSENVLPVLMRLEKEPQSVICDACAHEMTIKETARAETERALTAIC